MQRTALFRRAFGVVPLKGLLFALSTSLFLSCGGYTYQASVSADAQGPSDDVSYLAQYGNWTYVEPFGNVWQPSVSPDWRPFAYGHWVWTDAGWAWVSYEPYGWLVYHYGNWDFRPEIGWFWIEGSDWSPAPVQWLNYDGYSSWAPSPPSGVEWQDPWNAEGLRFWIVVRDRDFDRDNIGHYGIGRPPLPQDRNRRDVIRQPLGAQDFQKITGRVISPEPLKHDQVSVYMHPKSSAEVQSAKPEAGQSVQLRKMVLPKSEEARVRKYSPQVERKVLVPKGKHNQPSDKASKNKNMK